ncbi:MAG: hypothetical protein U5K71_15730 [Gracilimonas sp.]|nr:hypothetical protein [Gracilimonas sp.]
MLRNISDPIYTAGFEGNIGIEAAGDGFVDENLPTFFQQLNLLLLDLNRLINLLRFPIQEIGNGGLFLLGMERTNFTVTF